MLLLMFFEVSIKDHRRLRPFLDRYRNTGNRDWYLRSVTSHYDEMWLELLSVEAFVGISYPALVKHIAIGGNWYVDRNFLFLQRSNWQDERYYKAYNKARSPKYLMNRGRKIISIVFGMRDNMWKNNFIVNDRFVEETEQGDLSTKIGQWITSYLASEIDNAFFSLPYDHVKRILNLPTGGKKPDLVAFIWDDQEHAPFCILLEAKGRSNKNIAPNEIEEWKEQKNADREGLDVEYGVISATYNLYNKDEIPKCLYIDPEGSSGYKLINKDYGRLLNAYYRPFKHLIKNFESVLEEVEISEVKYYVLKLGKVLSELPYKHLDYHLLWYIGQHNFYLRKDFLETDWEKKENFSVFNEQKKIQGNNNLYIDYDWIWFGIEDWLIWSWGLI